MNILSEFVYIVIFNWRKVFVEVYYSWDCYFILWVWILMLKNFLYLWYFKDNVRGFEEWIKFDLRLFFLMFWFWLYDKVNIRRFWFDFVVFVMILGDFDLYLIVWLIFKNILFGLDNNYEYLWILVNWWLKEYIEKFEIVRNCGDKDNWGIMIIE